MKDTIKQKILAKYPDWHHQPFLFNNEEMGNPFQIYREFFEAYSLPNIRVKLWEWLYSACHDEYVEAINLLILYRHCERLIEASSLVYKSQKQEESQKDDIIHNMEVFFGIFSHELNTQLAGIRQCYECILEGKTNGKINTDYYLQAIDTISSNAISVLDNLLTTVKFHAGKLDIRVEKETFCFGSWVKTIIVPFEASTTPQGKDICLTLHPSLQEAEIVTDKIKLGQILHSLLANAVKFSYPGTCIVVKCYTADTMLSLQVINQGDGIPADKIEILFKPYQQVENGYGGTGLGLYVCQLYTESLGGKIEVQSEEKATTTFTVYIPDCIPNSQ